MAIPALTQIDAVSPLLMLSQEQTRREQEQYNRQRQAKADRMNEQQFAQNSELNKLQIGGQRQQNAQNQWVIMQTIARDALAFDDLVQKGDLQSAAILGQNIKQTMSTAGIDTSNTDKLLSLFNNPAQLKVESANMRRAVEPTLPDLFKEDQVLNQNQVIDGQVITRDAQGNTRATPVQGYTQPSAQNTEGFRTLEARARAANLREGTQEYQRFMATGGQQPAQTNIQLPPTENSATGSYGKGVGDRANERINAANTASQQNALLARMSEAMESGARTGGGQETINMMRNFGQSIFGLEFPESAQEQEIISSIQNQLVMAANGNTLGAGVSNKDVDFMKSTAPGLAKTPGGNALLIDFMEKVNNMKVAVMNEQQRIIDANGGVVPNNLDSSIQKFVDNYQLYTPEEKRVIEQEAKPSDNSEPEGAVAVNPQTGERLIKRNGQWVPL